MIENRSAPGPMIASLCYEDLEQAIAWLDEAFGFVEQYRYGPPDGIVGAQLSSAIGKTLLAADLTHGSDDRRVPAPPRDASLGKPSLRQSANMPVGRRRELIGRVVLWKYCTPLGRRIRQRVVRRRQCPPCVPVRPAVGSKAEQALTLNFAQRRSESGGVDERHSFRVGKDSAFPDQSGDVVIKPSNDWLQ